MVLKNRATTSLLVALMASTPAAAQDVSGDRSLPLVLDAHADVANPLENPGQATTIDTGTAVDLNKLRKGGVGAVFLSIHVKQGPLAPAAVKSARTVADAKLAAIKAIPMRHPEQAGLALTAADVRRIAKSDRTAILIALLNAYPYGDDPDALSMLYDQGVRMVGFTHAGNNQFADSSRPSAVRDTPDANGGLTELGKHWVAEANRLGILLDVSQLSTQALLQTASWSKAPVIASHSGMRALIDNPRNLTDHELDTVAKTGGAVCVVAFGLYLRNYAPSDFVKMNAVVDRYGGLSKVYELTGSRDIQFHRDVDAVTPRATLDQYIDSIDYAVKRIGIDHVCLSTDLDDGSSGIEGWMDESEAPNVTAALRRRGYNDQSIAALWSGNVLRVLQAAQDQATAAR